MGLEPIAERLASRYLPSVTARMRRIRALTVVAVGADVCEPFLDAYTADGTAPSWLAFEWVWAEAMARADGDMRAIPGIATTKARLRAGERLCTKNYLKGAVALGLHGFYRTLAQGSQIIDTNGYLDERGERLVAAWEHDARLPGFRNGEGKGGHARRLVRDAVQSALEHSVCRHSRTGKAASYLRDHLAPALGAARPTEQQALREALDADPRRSCTRALIEDHPQKEAELETSYMRRLSDRAQADGGDNGTEVAASIRTFVAFEAVASLATEAFDLLRFRSTNTGRRPLRPEELLAERHQELAAQLPRLLKRCQRALDGGPADAQAETLLTHLSEVEGPDALAHAVMARHMAVQRRKGHEGKLPWFDESEKGFVVRSPYVRAEPPSQGNELVHPSRIGNVQDFLAELA